MYNIYFYVIISLLTLSFILSQYLNFLNNKYRNKNIPEEIKDIYDNQNYKKSQEYGKANTKLSFISSSFFYVISMFMFFSGGFARINDFALSLTNNEISAALFFFGIIFILFELISIPFNYYSTFVIEEKFGFNKTTKKTFVTDEIKSVFLTLITGGGLLFLIIWFYTQTGEMFWIYAWISVSIFSVFITMFYSSVIVPLFNKQTPLEDGELKNKIKDFVKKVNFKLNDIYVIDGSKRTTKANAYFSGLGRKKRIVLYDTLIKDLTDDEIIAVLAHETGHYKKKHTLSNVLISIVNTGIMFFIFSVLVDNEELSAALGADKAYFQLGLIAFGILYSPISMIISIFINIFSRKNEFQADAFAKKYGFAENLVSGLKKLNSKNLSNLTPHPLYVFFNYSHPTLYQRIKALKNEN